MSRFVSWAAVAVFVVCSSPSVADEGPLTPGERKIIAELNQPTEMDFVEVPLGDVVDYLRDLHAIKIQLDRKAMDDDGIGADTPFTARLKEVRLKSGLNLLLKAKGLTYILEDEVLLITTPRAAQTRTKPLVFDVSGLVEDDDALKELVNVVAMVLDPDVRAKDKGAAERIRTFRKHLVIRASFPEKLRIEQMLERLKSRAKRPE